MSIGAWLGSAFTFAVQSLTYAGPLLYAATGELFSERVGVINIGLEGMLLTGAFTAVYVAALTHSPLLAVLAAAGAAALVGAVFALFGVTLRRDQVIVGTTINFLALGLTGLLFRAWTVAHGGSLPDIPTVPRLLGTGATSVNALTLAAPLLLALAHLLLFRTRLGVTLRATGEAPEAAAAAGTAVTRLRVLVSVLTGALCGVGGAALSIGINNTFSESMSGGRGFIALACVVFGRWTPLGVFGAGLLFAAADVLASRLQTADSIHLPYPILLAIPYLLTLAALAIRGAKSKPPAALGTAFEQG
jgi:simple sugar transport system permease protein